MGFVQGVNFRSFIKDTAESLEIKGYVRNLDDSRVEILAEGDIDKLKDFIDACKIGPLGSRVKNVETNEINHQGFTIFKIMRN